MKLTSAQLKKIIAEEVAAARLAETPDDPRQFYKRKSYLLGRIQDRLEGVIDMLEDLKSHEATAAAGDLSEIQALEAPLTTFEEQLSSLIDAVEEMI